VTRIQNRANVPFVRFKEYVEELRRIGLVGAEPVLTITEQGLRYIEEYRRVRAFLEQFGLADRGLTRRSLPLGAPAPDPAVEPSPAKRSEPVTSSKGDEG
jgi:Winged helix-turn-helix